MRKKQSEVPVSDTRQKISDWPRKVTYVFTIEHSTRQ